MLVNDIYRVRVFATLDNQTSVNVLYYRVFNTTVAGAGVPETAAAADAAIAALFKDVMSADAVYWGVGVAKVWPAPATEEVISRASTGNGTSFAGAMPTQVSGVFTKRTGLAGRRNRGRFYAPFPAEGDNDAGTHRPTAGYMTRLGLLAARLFRVLTVNVGVNSADMQSTIFRPKLGTYVDWISARANQKWGTQRRRGSYGRPNNPPG